MHSQLLKEGLNPANKCLDGSKEAVALGDALGPGFQAVRKAWERGRNAAPFFVPHSTPIPPLFQHCVPLGKVKTQACCSCCHGDCRIFFPPLLECEAPSTPTMYPNQAQRGLISIPPAAFPLPPSRRSAGSVCLSDPRDPTTLLSGHSQRSLPSSALDSPWYSRGLPRHTGQPQAAATGGRVSPADCALEISKASLLQLLGV